MWRRSYETRVTLTFVKWVGEEGMAFDMKTVELGVVRLHDVGMIELVSGVWRTDGFLLEQCVIVDFVG